jgi:hypothetical protein
LSCFDSATVVDLIELGATAPSGAWFGVDDIPPLETVSAWVDFLRTRDDFELIDFSARLGDVSLSTHDDGEAHLRFASQARAIEFVQKCAAASDELIRKLLQNRGQYVALRGDHLQTFETFEEYLAGR